MTDTTAAKPTASGPAGASRTGEADEESSTLTITVDGKAMTAHKGELVIDAAERGGVYIPRFCYHPRMAAVGMCRMCLVEIVGPRGPSLLPACYIPVADGQEVITSSTKVKKAQEGVLEFLLVNHPLDCPVCDKGGECPLQDQAVTHGPGESRFIEEKRHWAKPLPISDLVYLDRERCIQCARCTRFAAEVAGEPLIDFAERGDRIEVTTFPGQPFGSYFSGNTIQICPVGALTSPAYRFKARPWDLEQVETTCTTCAVGCRVVAQSSADALVRYLGVDSDPVNQSWLCDKGRYGYEAANAPQRLTQPLRKAAGSGQQPVSWHEALGAAAAGITSAIAAGGGEAVGIIGGARLTNEDAFAWAKLARAVIGTDSIDCQLGDGLPPELVLGLPRATIDDACRARVVLVICGDLREELPVLFLRLREAARGVPVAPGTPPGRRVPLIEISPIATSLTEHASATLRYLPGELDSLVARLLSALDSPATTATTDGPSASSGATEDPSIEQARLLLESALRPAALKDRDVTDSRESPTESPEESPQTSDAGTGESDAATEDSGSGVVVVLGRSSLAESATSLTEAALALHRAWPGARFLSGLRRGNVHGALDMGLAPGLAPGRSLLETRREALSTRWGTLPAKRGRDATAILAAAAAGELRTLVLLGADPLTDFPDRGLAERALDGAEFVLSIATVSDPSSRRADVVLPAAGADERGGTVTNCEGRVTRVAQKVVAPGVAWPDWTIASELATRLGGDLGFGSTDEIWKEIVELAPAYRGLGGGEARLGHRDGLVVPLAASPVTLRSGRHSRAGSLRPSADRRIDPMATPGIYSVEEQGAPLRTGFSKDRTAVAEFEPSDGLEPADELAELGSSDAVDRGAPALPGEESGLSSSRPSGGHADSGAAASTTDTGHSGDRGGARDEGDAAAGYLLSGLLERLEPRRQLVTDAYALRLVVPRRLYDEGALVQSSPSLAPLVSRGELAVAPKALERLGVADGERLAVRSAAGRLVVTARADDKVPEGVAVLAHAQRGSTTDGVPEGRATTLIDHSAPATDIYLETL
jgi:NADH-quinone oxidoreductase subunit G